MFAIATLLLGPFSALAALLALWLGVLRVFWPRHPPIYRFSWPRESIEYRTLGALLLMIVVLAPIVLLARYPFHYIVSGRMSAHRFYWPDDVGWYLDQTTLHKHFFFFTVLSCLSLPFVAVAQWMCNRQSSSGYWILLLSTSLLALCLLSFLIPPFYMLLRYIGSMGLTRMRLVGLVFAVLSFVALLGVVVWIAWSPPCETTRRD